jgi:hypothetical protein
LRGNDRRRLWLVIFSRIVLSLRQIRLARLDRIAGSRFVRGRAYGRLLLGF